VFHPDSTLQPSLMLVKVVLSGLYYKHVTIINDDSSIVTKLETSLTDDARVIIYDRHMFIVQATGGLGLTQNY
jgi:hypothetical protein